MADSISRQFARWAAELRYEDLPPEVVDKVKALMLHALTSAVLGAPMAHAREPVRLTLAEEGKPDGATILFYGGKASRIVATYANTELMHTSRLFDSYRMLTHPGPVLIPSAIVNAELERRNGRDIITALAAGGMMSAMGLGSTGGRLVLGAIFCSVLLAIWAKFLGTEGPIAGSTLAKLLLGRFPLIMALLPDEFAGIRSFFR